jgi:DNA polymerase-3 subunit beta
MLTAIRCEFAADGLRLAATDRYRLALRSVPYLSPPTAVGTAVLVPAHLLSAAATALDADASWSLGCTSVQFAVGEGSRRSVLRLLDASYPTIERLVPTEFSCSLRVDRDALLAASRRVTLADEQRAQGAVVLDVRADQVMVSSGSGPSRGRQRLVARADGSPVRVAFTAAYLVAALQALDGEVAVLGLNPGVGKVLVSAEGVDSYRHVLMSRQLPP